MYGKRVMYTGRAMGTTERRARDREDRRRKILDAARHLFATEGVQSVTMRRIADQIEYSPMALYQYFPKKELLLAALCRETFEELTRKLERMEAEPGDALARLKKGLKVFVNFGVTHPHDYILTFASLNPEPIEGVDAAGDAAFASLERGVEACVQEGLIHIPVREASEVLYSAIHGLTSLLITQSEFLRTSRKRLIETTVDAIVTGLINLEAR